MRVGEAIALDRDDVDLDAGRLVVRHGKFGKTRELALHPTTVDALRGYQRLRDRARPGDRDGGVVGVHGRDPAALLQRPPRLPPPGRRWPGSPRGPASCRPRIHDLRHSFAVAAMLDAYARRPGRADPADAAVDLARARRPGQHLLVSVRLPGADGRWPGSGSNAPPGGSRP